jgi:hypothetical protein
VDVFVYICVSVPISMCMFLCIYLCVNAGLVQVVQCLLSKYEALSSNACTTEKSYLCVNMYLCMNFAVCCYVGVCISMHISGFVSVFVCI